MWALTFIEKADLKKHIKKTIAEKYYETLKSYDLTKFNDNIIDPIKLLFDSKIYKKKIEVIIAEEISRQRDKTNNNAIGYFHQHLFKYIKNCEVPNHGFDVIYKDSNKVFYVEMKNKHNTMNSSSAKTTYIKLLGKVLKNKNNYGLLVEVISKHSQNVPWTTTVDSVRVSNERIRRVSIDKFYELVTKQKNAFYCLCKEIPKLLDEVLFVSEELQVEDDVVVEQLKNIDSDLIKSLFSISFGSYIGFGDLPPNEDK